MKKTNKNESIGPLRRFFRSLRWIVKSYQIKQFHRSQKEWLGRDLKSAEKYWSNRHDPNNWFLYKYLDQFSFNSLCEIGSNCGNRLYEIARKSPNCNFVGIDINKIAVEFGTARFRELNIKNVQLFHGEASNLGQFASDSFDVLFSWATLIYVSPDEIDMALTEMIRIAKKGIILIETHDESLTRDQQIRGLLVPPGNWKRNYRLILKDMGIDSPKIHIDDVPQEVWNPGGGFAKIITIELPDS